MATDQTQAVRVAQGLANLGASRGAGLVLFHAALQAQSEAAQVGDLAQRSVFGRRKAAPHPHAANDHQPIPSIQPAPPVA